MRVDLSKRLSNLRVVLEAIDTASGRTRDTGSVSKDDKKNLLLQMRCDECGATFNRPQAEYGEDKENVLCPECGSDEVSVIEK